MKADNWNAHGLALLTSAIVLVSALSPEKTWAIPVTHCGLSGAANVRVECTLVEPPETSEPGINEAPTTPIGFATRNGFVPIFEPASGVPGSAFPISSNPPGVVGAVSDYVIISGGNNSNATLVSDGVPGSLLSSLLSGLDLLQPVAADGTPIVVAEGVAEGVLDQPVEFYLPAIGTTSFDHFIIYSDVSAVPEPSTLLLFGSGLVGVGGLAWRRHRRR